MWEISYRVLQTRLHYVQFRHFCQCTMKTARGLSRGKIESVFGHFTKFNIRKTDSSQNSIWEKWTIHKIQYEQNEFFTKFNMRRAASSQNPIREKWTLMFYVFRGRRTQPNFFLEFTDAPWSFLEVKSKPSPFSHYQQGEKAGFLPKIV